jgi:beta-ureidopropionase / N-carbamoyl-L-amino-acid hydrolase
MNDNLIRIDADRLWSTLMEMAAIGATTRGGCNRQALTDLDRQGRDLFVKWAEAIGCTTRVDAVGNIFVRREGRDPGADAVLTGSHLDTQATGGKFDGVYGVLAGLEVIRTLEDQGIVTRRPVEVAVWTNEEGCRFAPAMLGSGVVSGVYDLDFAYSREDKDGLRFGDELARIGYKGTAPATPHRYSAVFEAHIEQGPILERDDVTIGVVTGIQGAYWFDVTITGASAHAGPTPMDMRRDPWRAATRIIDVALALADHNAPWGRATIGDISASPGSRNTVPESLTFTVDIRHPERVTLDAMVKSLRETIDQAAAAAQVAATIETVWHMPPTQFDPALVGYVEDASRLLGYSSQRIVSGAGHDSLHTASFAPTTMIFVPCEGGLSHNEAEAARPADLAAGANTLLHAILMAANTNERHPS